MLIKSGLGRKYHFPGQRRAAEETAPWSVPGVENRRSSVSGWHLWLWLIGAIVLGAFTVRLVWLQAVQTNYWAGLASKNQFSEKPILAPRGEIVTRDGKVIATSQSHVSMWFDPSSAGTDGFNKAREEIFKLLSFWPEVKKLWPVTAPEKISPVLENLPQQVASVILAQTTLPAGILVKEEMSRSYPYDEVFSHVVGYVGPPSKASLKGGDILPYEKVGQSGLEASYESSLHGVRGTEFIQADAAGRHFEVRNVYFPKPGDKFNTTLHYGLQNEISVAMKNISKPAAVVMMDANTGEIYALYDKPTFSPNGMATGDSKKIAAALDPIKQPLLNRAVLGQYPSGSLFKIVTALAGLAEKAITPDTTILSTGGIKLGDHFFPDWKAGGHGMTNLAKALAESVNSYFYAVGGGGLGINGVGASVLAEYARDFGFEQKTGVDLPNEALGALPDPVKQKKLTGQTWYQGDTYNFAIGQGDLLVTPLQIARAYAVVASNGRLVTPHLNRDLIMTYETIDESEYLPDILAGLKQNITAGSGRGLGAVPLNLYGKTGTAQYSKNKTHAWFVSFIKDEKGLPPLVLAVLVEGGGEGSSVALPVARDVWTWVANNMKSE